LDASATWIDLAVIADFGNFGSTLREAAADEVGAVIAYAAELGFQISPPSREPCVYCRPSNDHGAVVGPDGMLYSCWDTAGFPEFAVGHVNTGYVPFETATEAWQQCGDRARRPSPALEEVIDRYRLRYANLV